MTLNDYMLIITGKIQEKMVTGYKLKHKNTGKEFGYMGLN